MYKRQDCVVAKTPSPSEDNATVAPESNATAPSAAFTSPVTSPVSPPAKAVEVTEDSPAMVVAVAPRLIEVEPTVTALFVRATSSALTVIPVPAPTVTVTSPDAPPPVKPAPAVTPVMSPAAAATAASAYAVVASAVLASSAG